LDPELFVLGLRTALTSVGSADLDIFGCVLLDIDCLPTESAVNPPLTNPVLSSSVKE